MSTIVWHSTKIIQCSRLNQEAELLEERVYGDDLLPDVGRPFQVRSRKCRFGTDCNLSGFACRWSYLNPGYDPFGET